MQRLLAMTTLAAHSMGVPARAGKRPDSGRRAVPAGKVAARHGVPAVAVAALGERVQAASERLPLMLRAERD